MNDHRCMGHSEARQAGIFFLKKFSFTDLPRDAQPKALAIIVTN